MRVLSMSYQSHDLLRSEAVVGDAGRGTEECFPSRQQNTCLTEYVALLFPSAAQGVLDPSIYTRQGEKAAIWMGGGT